MTISKVLTAFAFSFLIVLSALIIFIENPEKKLYDKTVESIMIHEGLSSYQEALDSFPELKDIQSKMKRVTNLNSRINSMTGGPAPDVSRDESLQIQDYTQEISQLRSSIKEGLSQIIALHVEKQP